MIANGNQVKRLLRYFQDTGMIFSRGSIALNGFANTQSSQLNVFFFLLNFNFQCLSLEIEHRIAAVTNPYF